MNGTTENINLADYYFSLLKNLKPNSKLDLISKLSESLKSQEKNEEVTLDSLFGAYHSDETAEKLLHLSGYQEPLTERRRRFETIPARYQYLYILHKREV